MNLKKLASASKIYAEIKIIDDQIIELEKFAMLAANGNIIAKIKLSIEDLDKKKEEENKVQFDADGSLMMGGKPNSFFYEMLRYPMMSGCSSKEEDKNIIQYKSDLTENNLLQVLGILIYEKNFLRNELIKKLNEIGVEL